MQGPGGPGPSRPQRHPVFGEAAHQMPLGQTPLLRGADTPQALAGPVQLLTRPWCVAAPGLLTSDARHCALCGSLLLAKDFARDTFSPTLSWATPPLPQPEGSCPGLDLPLVQARRAIPRIELTTEDGASVTCAIELASGSTAFQPAFWVTTRLVMS